ncbi:MAG: YdcF family protein [Terracidiphilus sp.]
MGWRSWLVLGSLFFILILLACGQVARSLAPVSNTALTHFDAIIVLGTPADRDGNPTPEQLARVTEAVREYDRGTAPRLILTGGAAGNRFVEAQVMARSAEAEGVAPSAIDLETEAKNTIENACYAARILQAHGWQSAEVISSAAQLPRAGMIFNALPLQWRIHAAPSLVPQSAARLDARAAVEDLKTAHYLFWSRWADRCAP